MFTKELQGLLLHLILLNPFHATGLFLYPTKKHQKTSGSLMFTVGKQRK